MMKWEASRPDMIDVVPTWFAGKMRSKLEANKHKPSWRHQADAWLVWLFLVEVGELLQAIALRKPAPEVVAEAADVANFAMFLADKWRLRHQLGLVHRWVRITAPEHPHKGQVGFTRSMHADRIAADAYYVLDVADGETAVLQDHEFVVIRQKKGIWPWAR